MIPVATTTITIERPSGNGDPYEPDEVTTVGTRLPATMSSPSGDELRAGGERERVDAVFIVDVSPITTNRDTIIDDQTGDVWQVTWSRIRTGLGLSHQRVGVRAITGAARGF